MNESHTENMMATMVNPTDIYPMCFAFRSDDFRYLIVHHKDHGGRKILAAYNSICAVVFVESGFSLRFFPQVGQKRAVASTIEEQKGQVV